MILGIGVDLVVIRRMGDALERHGRRFAERLLTREELGEFDCHPQAERFLAKRFAVKEAFAKALGTGMRKPLRWSWIGTMHDPLGAPRLSLHPELEIWLQRRGVTRTHVSIADEEQQATAFVIVEGV